MKKKEKINKITDVASRELTEQTKSIVNAEDTIIGMTELLNVLFAFLEEAQKNFQNGNEEKCINFIEGIKKLTKKDIFQKAVNYENIRYGEISSEQREQLQTNINYNYNIF